MSVEALPVEPVVELDLTGFQGKRLEFDLSFASDASLAGYTSSGKIVDEAGAEVLTFTPTIDEAGKLWQFTIDVPAGATLGQGKWMAWLIVGGKETVGARGSFSVQKAL